MGQIQDTLNSFLPEGLDITLYAKSALIMSLGVILIAVLGRLFFGKKSVLSRAVSSAIGILFIYFITVVIYSTGVKLDFLVSPLPYIEIHGDYMEIFRFQDHHYTVICEQVLSMIILSFLANLADGWLPQGKNLFSWFFFRALSILMAMLLHLLSGAIITALLPDGLLLWAPVVLLGLLTLLLLLGALKLLVGAILSTVHPLIAILYTFFFANVVGKQISKAVLTTLILSGIVLLTNYLGCYGLYIAVAALTAYIPFLLILLLIWYLVGHKL